MKLRQKLAMVLATAMIVTAVPVVTMAASDNGFNKTISIVADAPITSGQGLTLDVKYTTGSVKSDVFYVTAQDFEFDKTAYDTDEAAGSVVTTGFEVKWLAEDELEVTVNSDTALEKVSIPVVGTPKKGTPAITIDGRDSFATSGTYTLSGELTTDKTLVATAEEAKNISIEGFGDIADIIIEEKVAEQLSGKEIVVTLPNNSDLVFSATNETEGTVTLNGERGLSTVAANPAAVEVVDEKEIKITMPTITSTRAGSVAIEGILVAPENPREDVKTGEVKVTVEAEDMEDTELVVANVADYGVTFEVEEVKTLKAGHGTEKVKVTIEETTAGSLGNKPVYLTIDGAEFKAVTGDHAAFTNEDQDEITIEPVQNSSEAQKYEVEIEIAAEAGTTGDVTILAENRELEGDMEIEVATVEAPFTVETETFVMKSGVKDQKGGKIVITEAEAGEFGKEEIIIKSDDEDLRITDAEVTVTEGDIEIETEAKDGELIITVDRTSDEASEITIENIEITAPGYMPEGGYDFVIGGGVVAEANTTTDEYAETLELQDFVVIGEVQVEGEASYKVGDKTFIHNGEEKEMDVAPYISAKNRVMVPVRFVAEAFGVEAKDIQFDQPTGTVTMFIGNDIVQLVNGQALALVNGIKIPMEEQMTIKEDRTFIPVGELARILDIEVEWDNETKTATFKN